MRYLDVGCGNGSITRWVGHAFASTDALDAEPERVAEFRDVVRGDARFRIVEGSSAALPYEDDTFDLVTAFEVLHRVDDLDRAIAELVRVVGPTGLIVVTAPHVWFPLETHSRRWRGREIDAEVPLLPYLRPLHRRRALTRTFSSRELDERFGAHGYSVENTSYAAPQFERRAASSGWEARMQRVRPVIAVCETVPFLRAVTGVSMMKCFRPRS